MQCSVCSVKWYVYYLLPEGHLGLVVRVAVLGVRPRPHHVLLEGVEARVVLHRAVLRQDEVAHVRVLHLGPGLGAAVRLRARRVGRALPAPDVAPVPVLVSAHARVASVQRPGPD